MVITSGGMIHGIIVRITIPPLIIIMVFIGDGVGIVLTMLIMIYSLIITIITIIPHHIREDSMEIIFITAMTGTMPIITDTAIRYKAALTP